MSPRPSTKFIFQVLCYKDRFAIAQRRRRLLIHLKYVRLHHMTLDDQSTERFHLLDAARGIGALSVVLYHWADFWFTPSLNRVIKPEPVAEPLSWLFLIFYRYGGLAVAFFFVLSGFIFYLNYASKIQHGTTTFSEFSFLRFTRLFPLHFLMLLVVTLLQGFYFSEHNTYFVFQDNTPFFSY